MSKEATPSNALSSSTTMTTLLPPSPTTPSLRWMPRFMCKSSSLICKQSPPAFSVTSITKVHTFGKIKQQNNNHTSNHLASRKDECDLDTNQLCKSNNNLRTSKTDSRYRHLYEKSNSISKKVRDSLFAKLPVELLQDIFTRLDCLTLYQLSLTCHAFRQLLQKTPTSRNGFFLWRTLKVESLWTNHQEAMGLYQLVCFLVMGGIHDQVDSLILDGCVFIDSPLLNTVIRAFPVLSRLSLVHCPQIDCWKILHMLKASINDNHRAQHQTGKHQTMIQQQSSTAAFLKALKKVREPPPETILLNKTDNTNSTETSSNTSLEAGTTLFGLTNDNHHQSSSKLDIPFSLPCLKYLTRLDIEGAFPSERSHKSYGHEMYCFGEIKRALLQLGDNDNDGSHIETTDYQQLSEGHYALYQFWLLLRSHMLRWDEQQQVDHQNEFRPPWLPETLVQFIRITEQTDFSSSIKIDLAPCPLCHRNVATTDHNTTSCFTCHAPTMKVCAQCRCHSCQAVLCTRCHHIQRTQFRQTPFQQQQQQQQDLVTIRPSVTAGVTTAIASTTAVTVATMVTEQSHHQDLTLLSSWRIIRCQHCHLPRRTCGQPSCVFENKQQRWTCNTCQQQRWGKHSRISLSPRLFKKSRHWSHWI
ncbi:hypothetical protein BC941DRAFT_427679 [Chlamydoabsidia padenii]|nr:hypothetical protein BC941DRAFT_427679 [Chlamydoabsidia padenii]